MEDIPWKEVRIEHRRFLVPDQVSSSSESSARGRGGEASSSGSKSKGRNSKQNQNQNQIQNQIPSPSPSPGPGPSPSPGQSQTQAQNRNQQRGGNKGASTAPPAPAPGATPFAAAFVRGEATDAHDDGPVVCAAVAQSTEEPTHFFSARLPATEFGAALIEFQDRNGFEPTTEEQRARSHVTLLMLKLDTEAEVEEAAERLRSLQAAIYDAVGTRTLMVETTGRLESMGSAPAKKAKIVAASVAPNPGLAAVQRILVDAYGAWDRRPFHPHITIRRARGNKTIDITGMAFSAKSYRIGTIELSRRAKFDADGYYHCEAKVILP